MVKELLSVKKLRIGYLISNFIEMERLFPRRPLFEQYNRNKFEVFVYVDTAEGFDDLAKQMPYIRWRSIADVGIDVAQQVIKQDRLNFLIDLSGVKNKRFVSIFSGRMAPIQAFFTGQINSFKMNAVEYLLTDRFCDPPGQEADYFTESVVYLPQTHFCYSRPDSDIILSKAPCKQNGYVTFGCFHYFVKLTDSFLSLWARILNSVPNSRLLLKSRIFGSGYGCQETRFRLKRLGFPVEQVEFFAVSTSDEILYEQTDILLGAYPYQSGYKICEALYYGIPVVQLTGKRHSVRAGYSILKNIGLDECIAFSEDGYVDVAVRLARNDYKLINLHRNLRLRLEKSALMDERRFIGGVERAYIQLWQEFEEIPKFEKMKSEMNMLLTTMKDGLEFIYSSLSDTSKEQPIVMQVLENISTGSERMKLLVYRYEKLANSQSVFATVTNKSKVALKLYRQERYGEVQSIIETDLYPSIEQLRKFLK